jgi:hypothetical protein
VVGGPHRQTAQALQPHIGAQQIVEPIREGVATREPLFDGIQQAFEELAAEYGEEQLETVIDFMRRAAQRTRQVTAELTGAVDEPPARSQSG